MESLENQKLKEEISKLKAERQSVRFNTIFEAIKTALIFIGGVFVFFWIQSPESILRRESSQIQISSARFAVLKEILNEKDKVRQQQLILAFKATYPNSDDLLEPLNFLQAQRAQELPLAAAATLSNNQKLKDLVNKKQNLVKQLQQQLQTEIEGGRSSSFPGLGPEARRIQEEITSLNNEISILLQAISASK
jgi:hypothetical protein